MIYNFPSVLPIPLSALPAAFLLAVEILPHAQEVIFSYVLCPPSLEAPLSLHSEIALPIHAEWGI